MRRVLIIVALVVAAAALGLWRSHGSVRGGLSSALGIAKEDQGEVRDEIRKSFQLQPGAQVEVQAINGSVEIQTSDTTTADVYVLRTANSQDALNSREIIIEQTANGLTVRAQRSHNLGFFDRLFGHNPNEQEEPEVVRDRKSTRLNSSHSQISYAVFCLKKKKKINVLQQ